MDRGLATALSIAWADPSFRAGLHELLDLPQTGALLRGLADGQDRAAAVDLLEAATATPSVQRALLLPIAHAPVSSRVLDYLATRPDISPDLVTALRLALDDPDVQTGVRTVLESADIRRKIWTTARAGLNHSTGSLLWHLAGLFAPTGRVFRLVLALKRHGVLRAVRQSRSAPP